MILLDLHQISFANIAANFQDEEVTEDYFRHFILNSIRAIRRHFRDYGEFVIAADARKNWRQNVFPYYKANRRKVRESSKINWPEVFRILEKLKAEISSQMPYRFIEIDGAEADDVIATIARTVLDDVLIISSDHDFVQLHDTSIKQYDWIKKRWIVAPPDMDRHLVEHIIRGDAGDGIPNIKSPDNCLAIGQRQTPITKKFIDEIMDFRDKEMKGTKYERNYLRNRELIDLSYTPASLKTEIMKKFEDEKGKDNTKVFDYFMEKRLRNLMENLGDFI